MEKLFYLLYCTHSKQEAKKERDYFIKQFDAKLTGKDNIEENQNLVSNNPPLSGTETNKDDGNDDLFTCSWFQCLKKLKR